MGVLYEYMYACGGVLVAIAFESNCCVCDGDGGIGTDIKSEFCMRLVASLVVFVYVFLAHSCSFDVVFTL